MAVLTASTSKCEVHARHSPASHVNEHHHVWPQGVGGPSVKENMVWVCATGHNNIHKLLALLVKKGSLAPADVRGYHPQEIRLARLGYQRLTDKHL
jgi:hypothetical protein